jgi:hypothetical protein
MTERKPTKPRRKPAAKKSADPPAEEPQVNRTLAPEVPDDPDDVADEEPGDDFPDELKDLVETRDIVEDEVDEKEVRRR